MRKIWEAVKGFFFPEPGVSRMRRVMPFAALGVLTAVLLTGTIYGWSYTNSSEFCGSTCHTMPPEYNAYLRSPHARVQCVECHIGRDIVTTQFTRKAGDLRHVIFTITEAYEFPIRSRAMRPARDSCEKCHFPEKFSDDSLRQTRNFKADAENSSQNIFLIMKTGGGSARQGLGRGIHWHIENQVRYLATDPLEQNIPYIRYTDEDGTVKEYYDIASGFTPDDVAGQVLETMDCITCHNRITHEIPRPEDAISQAMSKRLIPTDIPFIRAQTVELLSKKYSSPELAYRELATLEDFYAENYPEVYQERSEEIRATVEVMFDIYDQITFPEQKINWDTHPNNLGHKNDPGCFRCHDGKHLSGTGEAIRLECNICHSVPIVSDEDALVTNIEIVAGPEPASHTHSSWMTLHGKAIDTSCAACHEPADPSFDYTELEGKPPPSESFCGNSACHGSEWVFAGFDSPELQPILDQQLYFLLNTSPYLLDGVPRTYDATFKAMMDGRCVFCHSGSEAKADLDLSSYEGLLTGGNSGPGIVPGNPEASLIIQRQSGPRDHFGQVLDDELEALSNWIEAGAPQSSR